MKQKLKKAETFFARIFKQILATLPDSFIILIFLITFWRAEKSNSTDLLEQSFNMFYTILAKGILLVILIWLIVVGIFGICYLVICIIYWILDKMLDISSHKNENKN